MRLHVLLPTLLVSGFSFGQICTIDYSNTVPGIYPDTMPTGYVNQPYSEDITFVMPLDTQGYDFTNFHILSIALPIGLTWECNNSSNNCNYDPQANQYGCVNVSGTPLLAGQYNVDVTVIADLTVMTGVPVNFSVFMEILPDTASVGNNGFTMSAPTGCLPHTVGFTNNNPGLIAYNWDFGNGNTSTAENPSPQLYNDTGIYLVSYEAYSSLDTIHVYTLTDVIINSMSNYGEGFPSYEAADPYYIIYENGNVFSQSTIIANTDPPVSWTTSLLLDPANTYTIEIWESDADPTEQLLLYGADDFMGVHTMNLNGCAGCAAGTADISYAINHQIIYPTPSVVSVDTIEVGDYPTAPQIGWDTLGGFVYAEDLGDIYQWYLHGSPIAGATDTIHYLNASGYHYIGALNSLGCIAYSDSVFVIYCDSNFVPTLEQNPQGNLIVTNSMAGDSFQWFLDGNELINDTLSIVTPTVDGDYVLQVTDQYGCVFYSDPFTVNTGDVTHPNELYWTMSPNPASNSLTIQFGASPQDGRIQIIDMLGRTVLEKENVKESNQIDLSDMRNGAYMVQFNSNSRTVTKRLIIKH